MNVEVVNCFQNCIFINYSQLEETDALLDRSCELLSKLYFYQLFSTRYFRLK